MLLDFYVLQSKRIVQFIILFSIQNFKGKVEGSSVWFKHHFVGEM